MDTSTGQLQTAIIEVINDLIYHSMSFLQINREIFMKQGEAYFAMVGNKFSCSEHFLSTDFQPSLTGHRLPLKPGAIPSVFLWKKVGDHKESFSRTKRLQARCEAASESTKVEVSTHQNKEQEDEIRDRSYEQNDSVVFDPPTLEEQIEAIKNENERLLHELQESKSIEIIYKFGLERF